MESTSDSAHFKKCGRCDSLVRIIKQDKEISPKEAAPFDDPTIVRAAREEYCIKFMDFQTSPICWSCGLPWNDNFACKTCNCEFYTAIPDAKYCPACGSTDIVSHNELRGQSKSIDDLLDELDHEKFPDSNPLWKNYRKKAGRYRF